MNAVNKLLLNETTESAVIAEVKRHHPLFKRLTYQATEMIFQRGVIARLKSAQILFREGTQDLMVYIILCGKIIVRSNDQGILCIAGPGESVGEESFLVINHKYR
eukprot:TRINITY_DN6908_c0_g1_i2.p2 TRINITY_DN6908_c0_g1~~TRINITY_DN6908_c0_g1_i2.p2  ORF type:complete len:105 (-),score=8.23 TRINITY_DN6908_c0_g1_i2:248-562(-)